MVSLSLQRDKIKLQVIQLPTVLHGVADAIVFFANLCSSANSTLVDSGDREHKVRHQNALLLGSTELDIKYIKTCTYGYYHVFLGIML